MRRCRRLAIAALFALSPLAAPAQSCDLQSLATTLQEGTMPDLRGCSRAIVERALRVTEIRSDFVSGPSNATAGAVYDQDPRPGDAIKPGMLATIRVSEGALAAAAAGDGTVAGASNGVPAVVDATPADVKPPDTRPINAPPAGVAPTDATATDTASTTTTTTTTSTSTSTDTSTASPDVADSAPPASFPTDGTTPGDLPADAAAPGIATDGNGAVEGTAAGAANTGDAMAEGAIAGNTAGDDAITGAVTTDPTAPGNGAGLIAVPSGAVGTVPNGAGLASALRRDDAAVMPGWWWAVLALAVTLILAGVFELARQRRMKRLRPAWEQRVQARAMLSPQDAATPVGEIPLAALPFAVAASLGFGEATIIGGFPARRQDA